MRAIETYERALILASGAEGFNEVTLRAGLGKSLVRLGECEPGKEALRRAVEELERALALSQRNSSPLAWAFISNTLATALTRLAERTRQIEPLRQANDHLNWALEVRRRETFPRAWSAMLTDFGNVPVRWGVMTGNPDLFLQAIAHFRQALEVVTLKRLPRDYSETQNNIGFTLTALTDEKGHLESACKALEEEKRGSYQ